MKHFVLLGLFALSGVCFGGKTVINCDSKLGLQDGRIKTHQIQANFPMPGADVNDVRIDCCKGDYPGGFCLQPQEGAWLEVDFGQLTVVAGVAMRLPDAKDNYVKSYALQYMMHNTDEFVYFINRENVKYVFQGSANSTVQTSTTRFIPIVTRKIRILPVAYKNKPCFRMELLGCDVKVLCPRGCENGGICVAKESCACPPKFSGTRCERKVSIDPKRCNFPLGLENGAIRNNQLYTSSVAAGSSPVFVRLNCCANQGTRGWCPAQGKGKGQYVGIKFPKDMAVTKVAMQHPAQVGNALPDKYLTKYAIRYVDNGKMDFYRYMGKPATLTAAKTASQSMATRLPTPFITREMQIYVLAYEKSPCFRMEIYGCDPQGCSPEGCLNGGWCEDYGCRCRQGFAGKRCELSKASIVTHDVSFVAAKKNTLETKNGTFPTHGGRAILKPGRKGQTLALWENSLWYVDLGDQDSHCYANPDLCTYGLAISVYLRFVKFKDRIYVFSNGGDDEDSYGVSFYYEKNEVHFQVRTSSRTYRISSGSGSLKKGEWYLFELTWQKDDAITMIINKKDKKSTKKFESKKRSGKKNNLLIGASPKQVEELKKKSSDKRRRRRREIVETTIDLEVEGAMFWDKDIGILNELEVVSDYPEMKSDPVIKPEILDDGQEVLFRCMIPKVEERNVNFYVEWLAGEEVISEEVLTGEDEFAVIDESVYSGNIDADKGLACRVRSCFSAVCEDDRSPPRVSEEYKPEIKIITQGPLEIHEGGPAADIEFEVTLPPRFFCDCDYSQSCNLKVIATVVPKKESVCRNGKTIPQAVIGYPGTNVNEAFCGALVTMENWEDTLKVPVKAKIDNKYDRDQTRQILLQAVCVVDGNVTKTVTTTQITVNVRDRDKPATCKSLNDPHITTFDGTYYDNFLKGEFILYQHTELPFSIVGFFRGCGGGYPSCNCGAAAKIGDDVILLDRCGPKPNPGRTHLTVDIFQNGELTPGTKILRLDGGRKYQVIFPHGLVLTVGNDFKDFVNIWINAAPGDHGHTVGLCGTFNGKREDDLTDKNGKLHPPGRNNQPNGFSQSWLVSGNNSLYQGVCPKAENEYKSSGIYCECSTLMEDTCGMNLDSSTCPGEEKRRNGKDITDEVERESTVPEWCKKGKPDIDKEIQFPNDTWVVIPPEFPTDSGTTEEEAKKFCTDFIQKSVAGEKCKDYSIDLEMLVKGCMEDIKLTDSENWAKAALDSLKLECLNEADKDIDKWVPGDGGILIPPTEITDTLCDNDCSGKGKCKEGACECDKGFHGGDCSIDIRVPPIVTGIVDGGGLCPKERPCTSITVIGEKFVEVDSLVCKIQKIEATEEGYKVVGEVIEVKAKYVNGELVKCVSPFDGPTSVIITVSNDGDKHNGDVKLIVYDPECQKCDAKKGTCTVLPKKCFINRVCYNNGEKHPHTKAKLCFPPKNQHDWSVDPDCEEKVEDSRSPTTGDASERCEVLADLVFMLDMSPSIGNAKVAKSKEAVKFILENLDLGESRIKIGLAGFGDEVETAFNLNAYTDRVVLEKKIDDFRFDGRRGTDLEEVLESLRKRFFTQSKGARSDAPDIAIIFTDGESTSTGSKLRIEASKVHGAGIWVMVVNLGNEERDEDLKMIASTPADKFTFNVGEFELLLTLAKLLVRRVCQVGRPICEKKKWFEDKNRIIKGLDSQINHHIRSVEECKKLCDKEEHFLCKSFEYDRAHHECRLSKYNTSMIYDNFFIRDKDFSYHDWECDMGAHDQSNQKKPCVFPFKYKEAMYDDCVTSPYGNLWCATTPDYDKDRLWKRCHKDCVIPFKYNDEWWNTCPKFDHGVWCSITSDFDKDGRWKKC